MKEKRECKVVQDLLPNYIEKLTHQETNNYIEEHLKECTECTQILEKMKKEIEVEVSKREKTKVKYIKKYSKKLKIITNTIAIMLLLFIIVITRKAMILHSLSRKYDSSYNTLYQNSHDKGTSITKENNQEVKRESETYRIGDKSLSNVKTYINGVYCYTTTNYYTDTEYITLMYNDDETTVIENKKVEKNNNQLYNTGYYTTLYYTDNIGNSFVTALTTNISKTKLNGKKCYKIKIADMPNSGYLYVDPETGLYMKTELNSENYTSTTDYEYGVVTEKDIVRPEI